jgi:hypothetical protein
VDSELSSRFFVLEFTGLLKEFLRVLGFREIYFFGGKLGLFSHGCRVVFMFGVLYIRLRVTKRIAFVFRFY